MVLQSLSLIFEKLEIDTICYRCSCLKERKNESENSEFSLAQKQLERIVTNFKAHKTGGFIFFLTIHPFYFNFVMPSLFWSFSLSHDKNTYSSKQYSLILIEKITSVMFFKSPRPETFRNLSIHASRNISCFKSVVRSVAWACSSIKKFVLVDIKVSRKIAANRFRPTKSKVLHKKSNRRHVEFKFQFKMNLC